MIRKISLGLLVVFISLVASTPAFTAPLSAPTNVIGGDVSGVWDTAGSPYLIDGDITVPAGQTLTIEPGVDVLFQDRYSLTVNGTLIADGTENAPILFSVGNETTSWLGIRFVDAPDGSSLTYAVVEHGSATGTDPLDKGGGIYIENSNPVISYSTIRNNMARSSGGGIYIENSTPVISHSTIRDNLAESSGGGIYLTNSNATLIANNIIDNTAGTFGGSASGGGLTIWYSDPILTANVISGNSAYISGGYTTPSGYGGGLFLRGSYAIFTGNLISGNYVNAHLNSNARGGGLYLAYGSPSFVNNTITGNSIENEATGVYAVKEGGGIYSYYSRPTFVNTIIWNDAPEEIFVADYGSPNSTLTFAYSDLQGGQAGIANSELAVINWEAGNIDLDPLFVDAASGDYQLQEGSPAVDAGTAYFEWDGQVLVDLSSSEYNGSAPDMGAFESGSVNTPNPNQPPVAVASVSPDHGSAPLTVQFSSTDSYDPDGTITAAYWDFGDGSSSTEANPSHTYTSVNVFQVTLTVTDNDGATHTVILSVEAQDGTTIYAGNVSGTWEAAGSPYRIEGDITVPAGATLTIEPGALVSFQGWYGLTVNGTLIADGTENDPILFSIGSGATGWLGIRFVDAPDGSSLTYAIVENGRATGADPLDKGGGIYIENTSPVISHSTIRNNLAESSGGGIYLTNSNATLIANTIINNTAGQFGGSASGGGLAILYSNPVLTGNVISGNSVYISGSYTTPSGYGGGLFLRSSDAALTGNLISGNYVNAHLNSNARGGGLYLAYGAPSFVNNTITGNSIENEATGVYAVKEGGGIYSYYSRPTFVNTIIWNDAPEEIFVADYGSPNSTLTFAYSDLQGGQAGIANSELAVINWEAGNIDLDPLFVDAASGDYQLQEGSPAVDAGTAYFEWDGQVFVDLSSSEYNGSAPDMGAFESPFIGGSSNQAPVAVASANPEMGDAPLTVQFNSDGSYDPDGTINAFTWDFGDGNTSNEANPSHTYSAPGVYEVVLVITDDQDAAGSAAVTINVTQISQDELHVEAQIVSREKLNRNFWQGVDTILITDQNNQPVAGVTVTVVYSGSIQREVSGVTGADGTVTVVTEKIRNPNETLCFEVIDVSKEGYVYNPDANVVVVQCL